MPGSKVLGPQNSSLLSRGRNEFRQADLREERHEFENITPGLDDF